jgi:hypothetical protein
MMMGKNVNRPKTSKFGPTNTQPNRDTPSQRCASLNMGSNKLKKNDNSLNI